MCVIVVLPLAFCAPHPQDNFGGLGQIFQNLPDLPEGLTQGGADLASQGGRLLAGFVRTTSPQDVQDAAQAGNVQIPEPAQNAINNLDREAAASIIENGAGFVQQNAGNFQDLLQSLLRSQQGANAGTGRK